MKTTRLCAGRYVTDLHCRCGDQLRIERMRYLAIGPPGNRPWRTWWEVGCPGCMRSDPCSYKTLGTAILALSIENHFGQHKGRKRT